MTTNYLQLFLNIFITSPEAAIVAVCICALARVGYLKWYKPKKQILVREINLLSAELMEKEQNWETIKNRVNEIIQSSVYIKDAWHETESRVVKVTTAGRTKYLMYGVPRDLWNASGLLSRYFNLALAEAVPNILVGVGLLFTFLFLSLGSLCITPISDKFALVTC